MRPVVAGAALAVLASVATQISAFDRVPRPAPMETTVDADALPAVRFALSVDGTEVATFPHLKEIASAARPQAGDDPQAPPPPTGLAILSRPQGRGIELWAWHEAALAGEQMGRRDAVLVAFNAGGTPIARYHLENAWPAKIEINEIRTATSEVLAETVTLVCDRLHRVAP